ncbi:putative ABC transport system permease protein [Asanoa ferruginea]|uniref:Putative ABC transport system permease protein n=2 Tax=Asanoa ferruginea TaxID=53367 RepID=A0A3E0A552_9ACTN|nr:putative ABC transport system permease protein [Asanoa ferruginea]GIF47862.1 ABC transporter substrate-binding protein [Asanoa ferruginea]
MFRSMLRGLLTHKLRLALSALAVILGTMFISAAFVAGDTFSQGFTALFSTVNRDIDVEVTAKDTTPGGQQQQFGSPTALLDQKDVDTVSKVDGVEKVTPGVFSAGARVIGTDGKVIGGNGPPQQGIAWQNDDPLIQLRQGRPPAADNEIAINQGLAETGGFSLGGTADVITLQPRTPYKIVGIFGFPGDRPSLAGETTVAFTLAQAQLVLLNAPGMFTSIDATAAAGVSDTVLRDRIAAALPNEVVRTGAQVAEEQQSATSSFVNILKTGLVVFALIGMFTGAFLIFNTFSMLVAQRTRELALYRSFGASRGQVNRSVLAESVLLGLAASIVGLGLGILVGYILNKALQSFIDASLPVSGVVVRAYAVISTLLVGTAFTVVAALIPALRASRVPPIAAMREAVTPDKPLTRLTIAGAVILAAGALLLGLGVGHVGNPPKWLTLGIGSALCFLGVALLAPIISRPLTTAAGKAFAWSAPGQIGARNTGRNPRRTAVTAAALMIGVALATGAGVFAQSAKAGISNAFERDVNAQLAVTTSFSNGPGAAAGFPPQLEQTMAALPGVRTAVALRGDTVNLNGSDRFVQAGDAQAASTIFNLQPVAGNVRQLNPGEALLDQDTANALHVGVGNTVTMRTARGQPVGLDVVGIFKPNQAISSSLISSADAGGFRSPFAQSGFVQVDSDSQVPQVRAELDKLFADNPEVTVNDQSQLIDQANNFVDILLGIVNTLLALTIIVAVLGVVNTLLLSVFERTRELGLIRAVGMSRSQVARMITVESVLISVFGAALGIVIGVGLGVSIVAALGDEFLSLTVPWTYLVITLALAVLAGAIAAVLPAIRAARLNVLQAIAYE